MERQQKHIFTAPIVSHPIKAEKRMTKEIFLALWQNVAIVLKSSGLFIWFIVFVLALLEIKRYYNIDVIPGYDSSVDDIYGFTRGTISELFK